MTTAATERKPWYRVLYIQVLLGVLLGVIIGHFFPATGKSLKPLGDAFVKLIKMMIVPIVFCTVTHGIAAMGDMRKLGRVGAKTILYFEIVSTLALAIGLLVVNLQKPGVGFDIDPKTLDANISKAYAQKAQGMHLVDYVMNLIPDTFFGALVSGDLLQVLFVSVLSALAITAMGERGKPVLRALETVSQITFGVMNLIVKAAPIGAFGAMAFTIGSYGLGALNKLLALMLGFYATSLLFIFVVLGFIAWRSGFSIVRFLFYIKDELLLVLGTSTSETALPGLIVKLRRLGCSGSTVGLVVPTGYSFNLDGTNIYMAMAAVFLAQATNTPLDLSHQISLLLVAMLTSKGAAAVTGGGFIVLAATLATVPTIPIESLALLVGIDRFMSECRALTNLIGNGVATVVISRWENEVTPEQLEQNLRG